jgi:2-polyprenyl-3-methyl-5-hydroxy-6-metoxy-1,4-benzoquinol methylase
VSVPLNQPWDAVRSRIRPLAEEVDMMIEFAAITESCRILDLACGSGGHVLELARRGHQCTGVDAKMQNIQAAHAKQEAFGLSAAFVSGNVAEVELAESFDRIFCLYALSSLTERAREVVLGKINSWLRPNGRFVFNVIGKNKVLPIPILQGVSSGHLQVFSGEDIDALLKPHELKVVRQSALPILGNASLDVWYSASHYGTV